jgi:protein DGCR14
MAPPPAPKRIKRPAIVLDEDTYTSAVAHIIRRDFFPGLAETDAQREYLNALESKNNSWIREAGKKLTDVMTPVPTRQRKKMPQVSSSFGGATPIRRRGETPSVWGGDTPLTNAGTEADEEEEDQQPEVDLTLSLSAFQAKYISEDTESFSKIIDRQNAARFAKNDWVRNGNMYPSKQRIAQQKVIEAANSKPSISTSTSTAVTLRPSQNLAERPASFNTHKHAPFNTLMFGPDSIEDWATTRSQIAESASLAPPKAVLHHNTRLPVPDADELKRPPSPTMSEARDAIAGRPRLSQSEGGYTGNETPRVNGYAFVDAQAPDPEDYDDDDDDAPTDLLERFGAKADPSPFTINDPQRREKLHHKMVDRIGGQKSGKERVGTGASGAGLASFANDTPRFLTAPTPRPGITPGMKKNVGNLTPAAQRLFEKVGGGTPRGTGAGGFGGGRAGAMGREWTPTPKVRRRA